jgi:pyruvate/2-oxoglutarate dehydrogenase complex dihydrolipoamide dehydrogenase (E3) component
MAPPTTSHPRPSERINLHPQTHSIDSLASKAFDVIIIGSGWAGRIAAGRLVKAKLSVVIIEKELIGGDCPFWACVPSKVLLRPNEALQAAKVVEGASQKITGSTVDVSATFARRDQFTASWDDGALLVPMVESTGVQIVRGEAKIVGEKRVEVLSQEGARKEFEAKVAVIINSGSEPVVPKIPGLREANPWTPRDATSSNYAPDHLIVIGAGAVGSEMATAYASFGSKVSLISGSEEILPAVDPEAGRIVRETMESRGISVKTGVRVVEVVSEGAKSVTAVLSNGDRIEGTEILVAAGRKGIVEDLGLESVGIKTARGFVPVNDDLSVSNAHTPWLYATGDVNGRALLTHISKYHGRIAANAIIAGLKDGNVAENDRSANTATSDKLGTPQVIFTSPPVASVGLTRSKAKANGVKVREITAPFLTLGGRIHGDNAEGWAQWVVDDGNRLVGATFVGEGAADQIHASTVAIVGGLTLDKLVHAIPSFPTMSEVYLNLIDAAGY